MKTMKKTKRKIVVEIKGGCVRSLWVSRDLRGADVTVVDRDGMDEVDGEKVVDFDAELAVAAKGLVEIPSGYRCWLWTRGCT